MVGSVRVVARVLRLDHNHLRRCLDGHDLPDTETFLALPEYLGVEPEECWTPQVVQGFYRRLSPRPR